MDQINSRVEELLISENDKLVSRIWLPKGQGPWPALLMRQPYGKEIASTITYAHPTWFASHGYLVIIQDVRGQGDSTGSFSGFAQEASDTTKTLKWVRSLPECNGKIGTYGFSYQGFTQLVAEKGTPPPDCMAPAMTGLNEKIHWSCEGGAYLWHLGLAWGLQLAAQKLKRENNEFGWNQIRESLANHSYLSKGPELLETYDPKGMAYKWFKASKNKQGEWLVHIPLKQWLQSPMLIIGGWWDPHLNGILDIYKQSLEVGGIPELHIGPATHLKWWNGVQELHLNFFNKHLKTSNKELSPKPLKKIWNITSKQWFINENIKSSVINFSLKSTGNASSNINDGLLITNKESNGLQVIVYDPWRPTPGIGGHLSPEPGLVNRIEIDQRNDVATFTTNPCKNAFDIEGIPKLKIFAHTDRESFDLCVALSIVNESQTRVDQLSTGTLRIQDLEANISSLKEISMQPLFASISKGCRLRLSIAGGCWPAIGVNPGLSMEDAGSPSIHSLITTIFLDLKQAKLEICPHLSK
ncbi:MULTISPECIES: CocE/NonD family hydrolase [Prochlorococcus]|uniref:CocE/NonD family hydrolase n=1 Tax=Prochlorococcus TaxID=1218 RepID=UPI000533871B|nr:MULTISPECIES: CocE/NonD family hydrolase [Prochlorococcus]KGG12281.1 Alpha/beta hydrolase [Prochlorococcus sp. MIT 0601]